LKSPYYLPILTKYFQSEVPPLDWQYVLSFKTPPTFLVSLIALLSTYSKSHNISQQLIEQLCEVGIHTSEYEQCKFYAQLPFQQFVSVPSFLVQLCSNSQVHTIQEYQLLFQFATPKCSSWFVPLMQHYFNSTLAPLNWNEIILPLLFTKPISLFEYEICKVLKFQSRYSFSSTIMKQITYVTQYTDTSKSTLLMMADKYTISPKSVPHIHLILLTLFCHPITSVRQFHTILEIALHLKFLYLEYLNKYFQSSLQPLNWSRVLPLGDEFDEQLQLREQLFKLLTEQTLHAIPSTLLSTIDPTRTRDRPRTNGSVTNTTECPVHTNPNPNPTLT
jgi:hypothetical protein